MLNELFPTHRTAAVREAIASLAAKGETERGAVYTRPEVVRTLLDLAGYDPSRPLHQMRLMEPSFGAGDFLLPALDRLLAAFVGHGGHPSQAARLVDAIRGVEVHPASFKATHDAVAARLLSWGVIKADALVLVRTWLHQDDFLLAEISGEFDFVVGNPPYVRQERIPGPLLAEYRHRYQTVYDRADLYIPFYERGLAMLANGGRLAFICSNRWLKNKYGGPLRAFASSNFHLRFFIDLEGSPAFHSEVIAYPAITVFERGTSGDTRTALHPEVSDGSLETLVAAMLNGGPAADPRVDDLAKAAAGEGPWLLDSPDRLRLLRRLEDRFPKMESVGCQVGIGVATGADAVFIRKFDDFPVEAERKLPLVMAGDLKGRHIHWQGQGILNPFNPDGSLADLDQFPFFGAYVRAHRDRIVARHCAQKNPHGWYRTIDRIWPDLASTPKLVIPDIKGEPMVVLDEGKYYPHHNLYYIVASDWELAPLATVLRSSLAVLFVSSYCVRMNGGFLRFQAQYLRRIRIPSWASLGEREREALRLASTSLDLERIDDAVAMAYALTPAEEERVRRLAQEARLPKKYS